MPALQTRFFVGLEFALPEVDNKPSMADSFPCPQCGKSYSRENRLVGKAVVCECGHRFLVPPAEQASQPPVSFPSLPRRPSSREPRQTPTSGSSPGAPPPKGARPSQPSAPQRRPNQTPGRRLGQTRWADPIEPDSADDDTVEAEPMMIAEVVRPARAVPPAEDDFDDDAEEAVLVPLGAKPAPPARRPANLRNPPRRTVAPPKAAGGSPARLALMIGLPLAALLMIAAAAGIWYSGRGNAVAEADESQPSSEPPASGEPVTLFEARSVKRGVTTEFRVEFRLDGLKPDAKSQYRWVITGSEGWLEFPVPISALAPRSRLSGTAPADAGMKGPLRCYLEELVAGALEYDRVSNELPVSEAG